MNPFHKQSPWTAFCFFTWDSVEFLGIIPLEHIEGYTDAWNTV